MRKKYTFWNIPQMNLRSIWSSSQGAVSVTKDPDFVKRASGMKIQFGYFSELGLLWRQISEDAYSHVTANWILMVFIHFFSLFLQIFFPYNLLTNHTLLSGVETNTITSEKKNPRYIWKSGIGLLYITFRGVAMGLC